MLQKPPPADKQEIMAMSNTAKINKIIRPRSYYVWVGVFVLIILLIAGTFYYATQKVEYIWRWNRIPIYFLYQDEIEVISDLDGEIESIKKDGSESCVAITFPRGKRAFSSPVRKSARPTMT